jgi:hypothetical protein
MPAVSKKQEKFMQAVANNPKFAKKVGVPTSVGREFTKGKDMKKMEAGGITKKMPTAKQMGSLGMKSGGVKKMAGGGMPMGPDGKPTFVGDGKGKMRSGGLAAGHKSADGIAKKGKTKGKKVGMKSGGMAC